MPVTDEPITNRYRLEDQVGFLLRKATQRHLGIFAQHIPDLTATQFAALAKLVEHGEISQNHLGRETAMDAATIKGVIDRLRKRGLINSRADPGDSRRLLLRPSDQAAALFSRDRNRGTDDQRRDPGAAGGSGPRETDRALEEDRLIETPPFAL